MKPELILIPTLTIHPDKLFIYNEVNWSPCRPARSDTASVNNPSKIKFGHLLKSSRTANGIVSNIAKRKISRAIDYLLLMSTNKSAHSAYSGRNVNFKIGFITLTLPSAQIHSDNEIKSECLNQFLIEIKTRYHVKNYVWRAELQSNGNIHFHIIIDKFIYWNELRNIWNRIINKLGYVDRYREKLKKWHSEGFQVREDLLPKWSKKKQYRAYLAARKNDYWQPNSTDVHSVRKIINIRNYITKYMSKNDKNKSENNFEDNSEKIIQGRIWGCNNELTKIKGANAPIDSEIEEEIKKAEKQLKCTEYNQEYFTILYLDVSQLERIGCFRLANLFKTYLLRTFNFSSQFSLSG